MLETATDASDGRGFFGFEIVSESECLRTEVDQDR
jgi:hypothetical protein